MAYSGLCQAVSSLWNILLANDSFTMCLCTLSLIHSWISIFTYRWYKKSKELLQQLSSKIRNLEIKIFEWINSQEIREAKQQLMNGYKGWILTQAKIGSFKKSKSVNVVNFWNNKYRIVLNY